MLLAAQSPSANFGSGKEERLPVTFRPPKGMDGSLPRREGIHPHYCAVARAGLETSSWLRATIEVGSSVVGGGSPSLRRSAHI